MKKADIGMIGLAVMGENLVMNMMDKGFTVAVFNRTVEVVDKFVSGRAKGMNIIGAHTIEELVESLAKPRKIMMMIKAGKPVDDMIDRLIPLLEEGDIIIDGGNSHFPDTIRRTEYVESKGLLYIGTGVSGGEEGALKGQWNLNFLKKDLQCQNFCVICVYARCVADERNYYEISNKSNSVWKI